MIRKSDAIVAGRGSRSGRRWVILVLLGLGAVCCVTLGVYRCRKQSSSDVGRLGGAARSQELRPSDPGIPSVLHAIVLDGAECVSYGRGYEGVIGVSYVLKANYPANEVVEQIESRLSGLGWRRSQSNRNFGHPSAGGSSRWEWHFEKVRGKLSRVFRLVSVWRKDGERIEVAWTYFVGLTDATGMDTLSVTAMWFPAAPTD